MAMSSENILYKMLTVRDVSRILNIHVNTVRRWADQGILRAYRITNRGDRRFKKEDIDSFLDELNNNGGDPHKALFYNNATSKKTR